MISKYGKSKCGGCGETIQKVDNANIILLLLLLMEKNKIPTINHRGK
jgi:hypothetical protein